MKGVVFLGDRKLELREFPDPTPGPRDVVLEIKASGMCGSDLHNYRATPQPGGAVTGIDDRAVVQEAVVEGGTGASGLGPALQVPELHAEDRALQALHPIIEPLQVVMVLLLGAPVAEHAEDAVVFGGARGHGPALAVGAEVLAGVEAEAGEVAEGADAAALILGAVGLGVNDWRVVLQVLQRTDLDALMLAGRYSLLDQSAMPELLPECARRGVRIALGGVFNSGILATGVRGHAEATFNYAPAAREWVERTAAIEGVCEEFDVPLRAAALQFPLAHPAVEIVMVGARSVQEWTDTVAMMGHAIPDAFWRALRGRGLVPQHAPLPQGTA